MFKANEENIKLSSLPNKNCCKRGVAPSSSSSSNQFENAKDHSAAHLCLHMAIEPDPLLFTVYYFRLVNGTQLFASIAKYRWLFFPVVVWVVCVFVCFSRNRKAFTGSTMQRSIATCRWAEKLQPSPSTIYANAGFFFFFFVFSRLDFTQIEPKSIRNAQFQFE